MRSETEYVDVDVLIVGAGISGIGLAHYVNRDLPHHSWLMVEARDAVGGTWDLFRYPGVRSDSDLYTFGYAFRPWRGDSVATAAAIRAYLHDTLAELDPDTHLRLGHRVVRAAWCSTSARWTVSVVSHGETVEVSCRWLIGAAGYFDHERGHTPELPGLDVFVAGGGRVVHPQHWPAELDCTGSRVVVIGSGATAVTLVPALTQRADHVTMLQRSPSYVVSIPAVDAIAVLIQRLLPAQMAHRLIRRKNTALQGLTWRAFRRWPRLGRRLLTRSAARRLPPDFPVEEHFGPSYAPWDQRLCAVPDGDLFRAITAGRAAVVTDTIDSLNATGIRLAGGDQLDADVLVTATGLNLRLLGGIDLRVDGTDVDLATCVVHRGMMLSDLPNLVIVVGYLFSSWTLKIELVADRFVALVRHMEENDWASCVPRLPDASGSTRPLFSMTSGYVARATPDLPKQGAGYPWLLAGEYGEDVRLSRGTGLLDEGLRFARAAPDELHRPR